MGISWEITKNFVKNNSEELNPALWENNHLIPEVRTKLIEIANEFIENFSIKLIVDDIHIIGSNAGYNYKETSDIDLHILTNYMVYPADVDIMDELFNAKKNNFNNNYSITIKDFPVELYVEDINSMAESNGRYSVVADAWIQEPHYVEEPEVNMDLYNDYVSKIENTIESCPDVIDYLIDEIWDKRKQSIKTDGFTGEFNLVFKKLRADGYLDTLRQANFDYKSEQLSLKEEC